MKHLVRAGSSFPLQKSVPFIDATAIIDEGVVLGDNVYIWHFSHIRVGAKLGALVSVGKNSYVDVDVEIGRGTRIQNGVSIYTGVSIGEWCFVGPAVVFTNDIAPRAGSKQWKQVNTQLECGASIGAGAVIVCGVTIGAFAMVGAGAVVTRSIPPLHLVKGVAAKASNKICACGEKILPLGAAAKDFVATCCRSRLMPEVLGLALEQIEKSVSS